MPFLGVAYLVVAIGFGIDAVFDETNRRPAALLASMFGGMALFMQVTYPN